MNSEKAREFFSAYYDGTLEPGLRQTLERRFEADPSLLSEYETFEQTISELNLMRLEQVPVPSYLNERIHARLVTVRHETRPASFLKLWTSRGAVAAVAAAAVIGALLSIPSRSANTSEASVVELSGTSNVPEVSVGDGVQVKLFPSVATTLRIGDDSGHPAQQFRVAPGQHFSGRLKNDRSKAAVFEVKSSAEEATTLVALAGHKRVASSEGSGSIRDFAKALADRYGVTVTVKGASLPNAVQWAMTQDDAMAAAQAALGSDDAVTEPSKGSIQLTFDK